MWKMICTKIITTAVGTPTYITVWGGDIPTIQGTTVGTIRGIMAAGTAHGITVAGTIPGFTAMAAGMAGAVPGTTAAGIHPGTMAVGMTRGIMVMADITAAGIITVSMMVITAA
jgi:hypothetical protein